MKTLRITPEAADSIRRHITQQIQHQGLDFLYSPKSDLNAMILEAMQLAECKQRGAVGPMECRPFVVRDPYGLVVGGGRRP